MNTSIIKIGNSKGVILPSEILQKLKLTLKSAVSISMEGESIVIKPQPRQGWEEDARYLCESGGDELLIDDVFEDENFDDWTW